METIQVILVDIGTKWQVCYKFKSFQLQTQAPSSRYLKDKDVLSVSLSDLTSIYRMATKSANFFHKGNYLICIRAREGRLRRCAYLPRKASRHAEAFHSLQAQVDTKKVIAQWVMAPGAQETQDTATRPCHQRHVPVTWVPFTTAAGGDQLGGLERSQVHGGSFLVQGPPGSGSWPCSSPISRLSCLPSAHPDLHQQEHRTRCVPQACSAGAAL